jgi:hypothetical protein
MVGTFEANQTPTTSSENGIATLVRRRTHWLKNDMIPPLMTYHYPLMRLEQSAPSFRIIPIFYKKSRASMKMKKTNIKVKTGASMSETPVTLEKV